MRKVLFYCNTYFQMIVAMRLCGTLCREASATLLLSDDSRNAGDIYRRLEKEKMFDKVLLVKSRRLNQGQYSITEKLRDVKDAVSGDISRYAELPEHGVYDEFFYYNVNLFTLMLFAWLLKSNNKLTCSRFEEGILSYNRIFEDGSFRIICKRMKLVYFIRKLMGRKWLPEHVSRFYCFYPEHYKGNLQPVKIPVILNKDEELKMMLSRVFCLNADKLSYPKRYIFFASTGDFEGGKPIGEVALAKRIAASVEGGLWLRRIPGTLPVPLRELA